MFEVIYMMYYTARLRQLRDANDLTQREMSDILGISQQHYSLYELGKRKLDIEQVICICRALKVSSDYLLGLTDKPKASRRKQTPQNNF